MPDKEDPSQHPASNGGLTPQPEILSIDAVVSGGDGLARHPDGFVVFVPHTAPGEKVELAYTEIKKQFRRARLLRVIEPSPNRREPACEYYGRCGGCQLQHLDYTSGQLPAKAAIIADAFKRIGKIEIEPLEVIASPNEFGYRNRVSLVTGPGPAGITAGYHRFDDPSRLVEVDHCPLAEAPINEVWQSLRTSWEKTVSCLPPGPELRLTFRVNLDNAVGLAIEGGRGKGNPEGLIDIAGKLAAVWQLSRRGDIVAGAGAKMLVERIGSYEIPLAGTAFVQVNREVASRLDNYVRDICEPVNGLTIVDAYCGFGLRSLALAKPGTTVIGIERDRHAINAAKRLASQLDIPARFVAGDVEHNLKQFLPADTVILNPPRHGVAGPVIDTLLRREVTQIIYVSCNPATLARDVHRLWANYRLDSIRAFDLFPQTAHVETVAVLSRVD
jgi:23S rRNA (uracil1939-C5)-methyltransferase